MAGFDSFGFCLSPVPHQPTRAAVSNKDLSCQILVWGPQDAELVKSLPTHHPFLPPSLPHHPFLKLQGLE